MTLNFTNFNTDQDSYLYFLLQWHMLVRASKAVTQQMCIQSADPFCLYSSIHAHLEGYVFLIPESADTQTLLYNNGP